MKVLIISSIRCGGFYFMNELCKNHNLSPHHEPKNVGEIKEGFEVADDVCIKVLTYKPWKDASRIEKLIKYASFFDKVFILDRRDKEEQLRAVFHLFEYSNDMRLQYEWDDSMFNKKDSKKTKEYYSDWINRQTSRLEKISEVLGEDIIYYEDLYYQTDKVDLKGLKFVPDLKKKLRKKSEKKLV